MDFPRLHQNSYTAKIELNTNSNIRPSFKPVHSNVQLKYYALIYAQISCKSKIRLAKSLQNIYVKTKLHATPQYYI
jgi:hypothetical protein